MLSCILIEGDYKLSVLSNNKFSLFFRLSRHFATSFRSSVILLLCQLFSLSFSHLWTTHDFGQPFHSRQLNVTHARTTSPFCHTPLFLRLFSFLFALLYPIVYYFKTLIRTNSSRVLNIRSTFTVCLIYYQLLSAVI